MQDWRGEEGENWGPRTQDECSPGVCSESTMEVGQGLQGACFALGTVPGVVGAQRTSANPCVGVYHTIGAIVNCVQGKL